MIVIRPILYVTANKLYAGKRFFFSPGKLTINNPTVHHFNICVLSNTEQKLEGGMDQIDGAANNITTRLFRIVT